VRFLLVAAAIAAAFLASTVPSARAAEAQPLVREIFVPFADLNVLLENQPQRVLLTRDQYEELLKKAKKAPETLAPQPAMVAAADYVGTIQDERAQFTGTLSVDMLEDGLHALPLDVSGVGLRRATLDAKGASIGRAADGKLTLFVEGKGRHTLALEMVAPLETTAAQQVLTFRLPQPSAVRLRLTVPGDVEIKSGAAVVSRVVDQAAGVTRFEIVLTQAGDTSLVMTLNSRLQRRQRAVVARSVLVDEVTQAYERLHATVSLAVLHQAVDRFRFVVPEGFEVTEVTSPLLARWAIEREADRRVLDVRLREQTVQTVVLNISAARMPPPMEKWTFPKLEPLEVVGQVAVVGLVVEDRLSARSLAAQGIIPIDNAVLQAAIPATVLRAEPGAPPLKPVVAYYAPQADFRLTGQFARPKAELSVVTNVLLTLSDRTQEVRGGFLLVPKVERLFGFEFSAPAGWQITSVTGDDGKPLAFERFDEPNKTGRIRVRLPAGVVPGKECRVYFQATATPAGWLGTWESNHATFPRFAVAGATRDQGAIAVDARDDMVVRPEKLPGLTPLDETEKARYGLGGVQTSLAYRYEGQDYAALLAVERTRPRMTARTISFFRVESDALFVHADIAYQVEEARARQLSLSLPADTPAAVSIRPLDDLKIKEFTSEMAGDQRRWNVLLEEPRRGTVRLAVDFQQPVAEGKLKDFVVPIVQAEGVAYQSGLVAVEGSAELDVQVATKEPTRRVDVGELVDASRQPGRRLLGVWGFVDKPPPVRVSATRHPGYGLYPAIAQKAELSTILSPDGVAQTSAVFQLRTKALYLEVALPEPEYSELWSVLVDDKPVKPQTHQGKLLVGLAAGPANQTRNVRIVYETSILTVPLVGQVKLFAPKLRLRSEREAAGVEVPVADLVWHLYLPTGYQVIRADGTVVGELKPPEIAALNAAKVGLGAIAAVASFRPTVDMGSNWRDVVLAPQWSPYYMQDSVEYPDVAAPAEKSVRITASRPPGVVAKSPAAPAPQTARRFDDADPFAESPSIALNLEGKPLGARGSGQSSMSGRQTPERLAKERRSRVAGGAIEFGAAPADRREMTEGEAADRESLQGEIRGGRPAAPRPRAPAKSAMAANAPAAGAMPGMMAPAAGPAVGGQGGSGMPGTPGGMGAAAGEKVAGEVGQPAGMPGMMPGSEAPATTAPQSQPTMPPPAQQPAAPPVLGKPVYESKPKAAAYKARLEGMSSLKIDLQTEGKVGEEVVTFASLGVDPELVITLANRPRLAAFGWALALAIVLVGLARTNRSFGCKARLVIWVIVIGTLVPLAPYCDALTLPCNMAVYAASALVPYYLAAGLLRWLAAGLHRIRVALSKPAAAATTAVALLLVASLCCTPATGAEPAEKSGPYVIEVVGPPEPVKVPDDAVILPYDPDSRTGVREAYQIMVPYPKYVELWNLAYPEKRLGTKPPPAPYALASGSYTARLEGDEFLVADGQLEIDVFTDEFVAIPLALQGGVLARAELDGKPAQISVAQPAPNAAPSPAPGPLVVLHASGKGRHKLQLAVRLRMERRGGWRAVEAALPAAPATAVAVIVPQAQTEVRLSQVADRRSYETSQPGQQIETALGVGGRIGIEWRPKVGEAQVDRTLTAQSEAVFDIQEDGLRMAWLVALEFRRTQRETFRLFVPGEYLVEKVEGANVRGWEIRKETDRQVVDVTLLKPAKDRERFTLRLWRAGLPAAQVDAAHVDAAVRDAKAGLGETGLRGEFDCPLVRVADAALESGQLTIRRSPLLDVRTLSRSRVTRTDLGEKASSGGGPAGIEDSPLGIRPYEAYQFVSMPFAVRLSATPIAGRVTADTESVLKIAAYERSLECRVKLDVRDRPIHRVEMFLPQELKLEHVSAPGDYEWTVTQVDKRPLLTVLLAAGRQGEMPVVIRGTLGGHGLVDEVPLPRLEVRGVERQAGDIAVQADPVFDVKAAGLEACESVLRDRLRTWLKPQQVAATTLALHCRGPAYRGTLRLTLRKPDIACETITNVLVTDRAVEETILLDFTIEQAGTRELTFLLPSWMKDSRIQVPLLRQKTVAPTAERPDAPVRVRLELQDEVMHKVRVLVENDRLLLPQRYLAPIPGIESGTVTRQFVALQSAGRDELVVDDVTGLDPVSRQQQQILQGILRGGIYQAFLVQAGVRDARLGFTTRTRVALETTGARIGLAETALVFDTHGAYRAELTYRVDNSTKQSLEVELPEGATLWTVSVAGEPVKPVRVPSDSSPRPLGEGQGVRERRVRIPLVKTAPGDLDFPVVLKYGGQVASLGSLSSVTFPLVKAVDIEVELSQVRLYLPETHHFFDFGGTVRLAESEDDLVAGQLSYETKRAQRLLDTMRQADDFSKARAASNLRQLGLAVQSSSLAVSQSQSKSVQDELAKNTVVMQEAAKALEEAAKAPARQESLDNRYRMNYLYEAQRTSRAKNVVKDLGRNFDAPMEVKKGADAKGEEADAGGKFNAAWFANAQLASPLEKATAGGKEAAERQKKKEEAAGAWRFAKQADAAGDKLDTVNPGIAAKQPTPSAEPPQPAQQRSGQPRGAYGSMGRAGGSPRGDRQRDAVERYKEQLSERGSQELLNQAAAQVARGTQQQQSVATPHSLLEDAYGNRRAAEILRKDLDVAVNGRAFGPGMPQQGGFVDVFADVAAAQQAALPTGLASLDFDVPKRGTLYRFTTPGGDVKITARAASAKLTDGLVRAMCVLVGAWLVVMIARRAKRGSFAWMAGPIGLAIMGCLGAALLVLGFVLVGLALIVLAIVLAVRLRRRKRAAPALGAAT
jgi:hypothetical protein